MKKKKKIIEVKEIHLDIKLYPREEYSEQICKRYAKAMKKGDVFPPIVVAEIKGQYFLVDGKHRLEAHKKNRKNSSSNCFVDCEVLEGLSNKEIYLESVKRNLNHGIPFYDRDIEKIKSTLQYFKLDKEEIAEIVKIPVSEMTRINVSSIKRIGDNTQETERGNGSFVETSYVDNKGNDILDEFLDSLERFNDKCRDFKVQFNLIEDHIKERRLKELRKPIFRNLRNVITLLGVSQRFIRYREELIEIKGELEKVIREATEYEKPKRK